jgi:hypothetical protein
MPPKKPDPSQVMKQILRELVQSALDEERTADEFAKRKAYGQAQARVMFAAGVRKAGKHVEQRFRELMGLL